MELKEIQELIGYVGNASWAAAVIVALWLGRPLIRILADFIRNKSGIDTSAEQKIHKLETNHLEHINEKLSRLELMGTENRRDIERLDRTLGEVIKKTDETYFKVGRIEGRMNGNLYKDN